MRSCSLVALLALSACHAPSDKPTVTVAFSPGFDAACALVRGGQIKEEWKRELKARKPEFEKLWRAVGPELIDATERITGKPFPARNFNARLTLCTLPSQSMLGTSVNMRYALKSFTAKPVPLRYKVDTLFHELLHEFLAAHPAENSRLLEQHAALPERTRNHLHLLALQKAILLQLDEREALQDVIAIDSQLPGGYYKRAWEIVNASDATYLKFVEELKR